MINYFRLFLLVELLRLCSAFFKVLELVVSFIVRIVIQIVIIYIFMERQKFLTQSMSN